MHLIIASRADRASMSMANYLLENVSFGEVDKDTYQQGDYSLRFIEKSHLNYDTLPEGEKGLTADISDVTFLSSHSSKAQIKSLTAHPTGNFQAAMLGGRERALSLSSPARMTSALKTLISSYNGNGFEITLEATHHGPYLEIPNYYLEIGTTEKEWGNVDALEAVREAVFAEENQNAPNFVGAGGGHYMPKVTRYVTENEVNVGHLISKHPQESITAKQVQEAVTKTPNCRGFIMDRKGCRGLVRVIIRELCDDQNLELIKL